MDDFAMPPPLPPYLEGMLIRRMAPFVPRGRGGMQIWVE